MNPHPSPSGDIEVVDSSSKGEATYKSIDAGADALNLTGQFSLADIEREQFFENSPQPMFIHDRETLRFLKVNDAAIKLYGYTREEFLSMRLSDIRPSDDIPETLRRQRLPTGYLHYRGSREHRKKSGEIIEVDVFAQDILYRRKEARVTLLVDITARKRAESDLRQQNQLLDALIEMSHVLLSCLTVEEACRAVPKFCQQLFPGTAGSVYLLHASRNNVESVAIWREPALNDPLFPPQDCWALRRGQVHFVGDPRIDLVCDHMRAVGTVTPPYVCVPMIAQTDTLGLLSIEFPSGAATLSASQKVLATTLAEQLALVFANLKLRDTLRQQSIRDPLTKLFNRRYLEESLQRELARARRHATPITFIMIDVDHFKRFNDTFGHDAGDVVLKEFAGVMERTARSSDVPCRFGGEEFSLLLPDTPLEGAKQCAEKLRVTVEQLLLLHGGRPLGHVTISMGIALFPEHGDTAQALVQHADAALYQAKKGGRNRAVVSGESASIASDAAPAAAPAGPGA